MAARRTDMFFVALTLLFVCINFYVKKGAFITGGGVSVIFHMKEIFARESFTYSSIFCGLCSGRLHVKPGKALLFLLLLACGDIETCPGPDAIETVIQSRGLKIVHQNVQGLFNNMANLTTLFSVQKNIIITLSETHIKSHSTHDNNSLYEIPGFSFNKRNRSKGKGGGVAMYISGQH